MSNAYENLRKHLGLAIRQLKEIKDQKKKIDIEELCSLENQGTILREVSNNSTRAAAITVDSCSEG